MISSLRMTAYLVHNNKLIFLILGTIPWLGSCGLWRGDSHYNYHRPQDPLNQNVGGTR